MRYNEIMEIKEAKAIIQNNYECKEDCFVFFLHEKNCFRAEQFWNLYDSIASLVVCTEKDPEISKQITHSYEFMLECFIYHLDPKDGYEISGFPDNYSAYMERLEYIVTAYRNGIKDLLDDSMFELQR